MGRNEDMVAAQGRRISQMADELLSLIQRLRAVERRVSMLEDYIPVFASRMEQKQEREK